MSSSDMFRLLPAGIRQRMMRMEKLQHHHHHRHHHHRRRRRRRHKPYNVAAAVTASGRKSPAG